VKIFAGYFVGIDTLFRNGMFTHRHALTAFILVNTGYADIPVYFSHCSYPRWPYSSSLGVSGLMKIDPGVDSGYDTVFACASIGLTTASIRGFSSGFGGAALSGLRSRCRLNSAKYFAKVGAFTAMPFSWSFCTISWVSKPRFFILSSVGARATTASFTLKLRLPSKVIFSGLSLASAVLISLTLAPTHFASRGRNAQT